MKTSPNASPNTVDDYEILLTDNRIWKQRLVGISVGVVSPERARQQSFTGPMIRISGIAWDLRKKQPYAVYDKFDFDIPIGTTGDNYDRYLVRMAEMRQSNRIIKQCNDWLRKNPGPVRLDDYKIAPPPREPMGSDAIWVISLDLRGLQDLGGLTELDDRPVPR